MHILLINTNPVVSRLMRLCIKEEYATLDEVPSLDHIKSEPYDIVFIDDILFNETSHDVLQRIDHNKLVLFSAQKDIEVPSFIDEVIKKPFLPSRVIEVIESIDGTYSDIFTSSSNQTEVSDDTAEAKEENDDNIFGIDESDSDIPTPSSDEVKILDDTVKDAEEAGDNILDIDEIEKIKSLLETSENEEEVKQEPEWEDEQELEQLKREVIKQNLIDEGLEIVEEDVMNAIEPDLNVNITHDINDSSKETFEEELLKAVQKMKIKKLKKLLKGAQITINIRFKDDNA
jgi:hypothetical protein